MTWDQFVLMLRTLSAVVWGFVFLRFASSIVRVLTQRAQHYDVLVSLIGAIGAMVVGYNVRWIASIDNRWFYAGLYIYAILLGITVPIVVSNYRESRHG